MDYDVFDSDEDNEEIEHFYTTLSKKELANARSRLRGKLKRDTESSKSNATKMANYILSQSKMSSMPIHSKDMEDRRKGSALAVGVSNLSKTVLQSLGINIPVRVTTTRGMHHPPASGHTDFKSMTVHVNPTVYKEHDENTVAELIHLVKGVMYHEGGHNLWTIPYAGLVLKVNKVKEKSVLTMEEFGEEVGRSIDVVDLHRAWNILEDQRMETAMCATSPVMAKYFTTLVLKVVLNYDNVGANWPYIVGRTYLPKDVRLMIRTEAEKHKYAYLIERINECVMRYRRSTDYREMFECVIEFCQYLKLWGVGGSSTDYHDNWATYEGTSIKPSDIPSPGDYELEKPSSDGDSGKAKINVITDFGDSAQESSETHEPNDSSKDGSSDSKSRSAPSSNKSLKELADEEVKNNIDSVPTDEVHEFMSNINEILSEEVLPDESLNTMSPSEIADTKQVCNKMINTLEQLVVQIDPAWQFRLEEGVLDPTTFMTKDIGDTDYWSGLDGIGANGHNLAVSVLLDSSGSMGGLMESLSVAAMGIRKACEYLDIPCTVTTFNDDVRMMSPANKEADFIKASATGGTSPYTALNAMNNQRYDKDSHLVVILTDGEWCDVQDVRPWCSPGRYFVIAGIGWNILETIQDKGADHYVVLDNVMELPKLVTHALVGFFK
jgi:hypothetical protein